MPLDSNGIYSLPTGYFVRNGDTVSPSQHNPPLEDIASAISQMMPKDGRAPATGAMTFSAGTESNPGVRFQGSTGTGFYMPEPGVVSFSSSGTTSVTFSSDGISFATTPAPEIMEHEETTGTVTFDYEVAAIHKATMTGAFVMDVTNIPEGGDLQVNLTKTGTSGALTFTGVTRWVLGVDPPSFSVAATGLDPANLPDGSQHVFVFSNVGGDIVGFVVRAE